MGNSNLRSLKDRKTDRSHSPSIIEKNGMRVPNLNFSKLKSNSRTGGKNIGPKTSRDILRNKVQNLVGSKSNSRLNDSSLNNSVNEVFKSITTNRNNGKSHAARQRLNFTPINNVKIIR